MKTYTRDTLAELRFISNPLLSPNGKQLAYRQTRMVMDKNAYKTHIRIFDTESARDFALSSEAIATGMRFIDDETLSFIADRDSSLPTTRHKPETKLYKIALHGGEAQLWLSLDCELENYYIINEDELLLQVTETKAGKAYKAAADDEKSKLEKELKEAEDYEVLEEAPFWFNGKSFTSGERSRIYRYRISSQEYLAISDEAQSSSIFDFDSAQGRLLFVAEENPGLLKLFNRLYLYELAENNCHEIVLDKEQQFYQASFAGQDIVFMASDMASYGLNEDAFAYILRDGAEQAELLSKEVFVESSMATDVVMGGGESFVGTAEGVYYCSTEGTNSYLKLLRKNGEIQRLTDVEGAVSALALNRQLGQASLYFTALRGLAPQEIYRLEEGQEEQLTFANQALNEYETSTVERFSFEMGADTLQGFVLKPLHYEQGKKYPAILTIHGGPKTVYGAVLNHEMQMLAAQGYFVFFTNPRGSDGYGSDWADIRGRYGEIDYQQFMRFTDVVLERYPEIDQQKLGVIGGSYGGFMTNWIIGQTTRFAAACTQRSISNWFSMYGISDIGFYFTSDQCAADPWSNPQKLWALSPLKYADQIKTPTLIIHSDEDYRCPIAEGMQLYTALKVHDVPTRMVIFKGENHELSRSGKPLHRLRRLAEISDWFEQYLK